MSARSATGLDSALEPAPTASDAGRLGDQPANPRQCGRCRQSFPGDPTLHPLAKPDWWLCSPCREALFGHTGARVVGAGSSVEETSC
jgi:hypothetical protein